ncbi:MAG TPA: hypothetical protein VK846_19360 [Candidatus Limnocylindria bacterium]|nr:hypothetical protein [Candidatus Limnocylindria bacterium]
MPVQEMKMPSNAREHAVTWLFVDGTELMSTQGNLHAKILSMKDRFLVDTNAEWFDTSHQHPETAFLLGTTVDKEISRLESIFANSRGTKVRPNVFLFGVKTEWLEGQRVPLLRIDRLDSMLGQLLDLNSLREFDALRLAGLGPDLDIVNRKKAILRILGVDHLSLLPSKNHCRAKDEALKQQVHAGLGQCTGRFRKCVELSEDAYARLLIAEQSARHAFLDEGRVNTFGDTNLIQNALFFGAGVLSTDSDVRFMASVCRLPIFGRR